MDSFGTEDLIRDASYDPSSTEAYRVLGLELSLYSSVTLLEGSRAWVWVGAFGCSV